jgi:osmotically-inducible protein OsmY
MKKGWAMLGGLGLGAGLMYILDPSSGRKRRQTAADKAGTLRTSASAIGRVSRDIGKEAWGLLAEAQGAFDDGPMEADGVLADHVRERLRRAVTRPDAVEIAVRNGVVTLTGTVPAKEFDRLVSTVLRVRGVRDIDDRLDVRPIADGHRDFEDTPAE